MDAGGLAQMSYNNFPAANGLGMPVTGFAARRANGSNIKRLSFEPTKASDPQDNGAPTPRTSRSHLLAGLRTAPKSATSANFPSTAPPTQVHHNTGINSSMYADNGPKTSGFQSYNQMNNRQMYSVPEQILAPPEIHIDEHGQEGMDPNLYAQLVATNLYLAEQQQRLQQQLLSVQAAAQQMQGMNLNGQQQFATPPITPQNMGMYQQQQIKNMQPVITPVMGQPGIYSYYNPMTGQQTYFMDNSGQQNQYVESPIQQTMSYSPPQQPGTPRFQVSPPPQSEAPSYTRSISPPKKSASPPQDHAPLPPPSAGAFRRGHRKANSLAMSMSAEVAMDGPKSAALPKNGAFPGTPTQTGFGPGAGRAGEHPIRQPRGPPSLDELKAKPTTKFEGSKNFATRTRRSAVHNLVRAGLERRRAPGSATGSMSPLSEAGEMTFSDNDSDSGRSGSGSLSGRPSLGSRGSQHGAIGSNRPSSRQNSLEMKSVVSVDSTFTTESVSGDESNVGGSFAAVFKNGGKKPETADAQKKAPMLVLTSAEKRKSSIF
ncbi:transcription initiation factor IIF subunit alpha protein [Rutstroemia sp. NJR-2017a BVV2]|nr:transcription initiation factor IIF subunit alpha protein [Rutstroemia sp. NJR-2017a BVV2]